MRACTLSFDEIRPFVRYAQLTRVVSAQQYGYGQAYDCRLFFLMRGAGAIHLAEESYPMREKALLLLQSATPYVIAPDLGEEMELFVVNFDYTQANAAADRPLPLTWARRTLAFEPERVHLRDCPALDGAVFLEDASALLPVFLRMQAEYMAQRMFSRQQLSADMLSALIFVARGHLARFLDAASGDLLERVLAFIRERYAQPIDNRAIAEAVNYHPNYLNRLMLRMTGQTLHKYLVHYRVRMSLELVMDRRIALGEVALRAGFHSASQFTKAFSAIMGAPPSRFRAAASRGTNP